MDNFVAGVPFPTLMGCIRPKPAPIDGGSCGQSISRRRMNARFLGQYAHDAGLAGAMEVADRPPHGPGTIGYAGSKTMLICARPDSTSRATRARGVAQRS
jgi:hypothetical protein